MANNDGGPAFPSEQGSNPDGSWNQTFEQGMSLRDYFIAHAPAEPQPWFTPKMPDCEVLPSAATELSGQDLQDWNNERLDYEPEKCSATLKDFCERLRSAKASQHRWQRDYAMQRYVQWPAAWADEQLKARLL